MAADLLEQEAQPAAPASALPAWVGMFLFGIGLAVVMIAGPLIRLP